MSPRKRSELTVTDQFCGAGGSSIGAEAAGCTLALGLNHWRLAIETHASNFPDAAHDCADIANVDPRRYPSTDILLTSPECTNHSTAKNHRLAAGALTLWDPKKDAERSRATMWDVPRFAEYHDYNLIIAENVVEVRSWKPYDSWLRAMHDLGYDHGLVYWNSMFSPPTPQSRDRLYTIFWKKNLPAPNLDFTAQAECPACGPVDAVRAWKGSTFEQCLANATKRNGGVRPDKIRWGLYGQQYLFRCPTCSETVKPMAHPAYTAIDWTLPGQRIGDRASPLAEATMARIQRGIERYGRSPVIVPLHHTTKGGRDTVRSRPIWEPFPTQSGRREHGFCHPFLHQLAGHAYERADSTCRSRDVRDPLRTQTGTMSEGLVFVPFTPFIAELRGGGSKERAVTDHLSTVTADGNHHMLVDGFVLRNYGEPGDTRSRPFTEQLGAVTTQDHHGVLRVPLIDSFYRTGVARPVTEAMGTCETRDRHGLIDPGTGAVDVQDCYYRMLEPHEIQRAMAFGDDYRVLGDKRAKVRQLGNAVTPPTMRMLVERCVDTVFA